MAGYITIGIVVFCMLVEITPIKINPIACLGKMLNKHTNDKLDNLEKIVDNNDIDTVRSRILANDKLLAMGEIFKEDEWNSLYKDIEKWNKYHEKYPNLNGIIRLTIEHIEECYKKQHYGDK